MAGKDVLLRIWKQAVKADLQKTRGGPKPQSPEEARLAFDAWAALLADVSDEGIWAAWIRHQSDRRYSRRWPDPDTLVSLALDSPRSSSKPTEGYHSPPPDGPAQRPPGARNEDVSPAVQELARRSVERWREREGSSGHCSWCHQIPHDRRCPIVHLERIGGAGA